MLRRFWKAFSLVLGLAVCVALMPTSGYADYANFNLNLGNGSTLANIDYGTLKLTLNGTEIDVAIDLTSGAKIVNTGNNGIFYSVAFNMTGTDVPIGVTNIIASPTSPGYSLLNSGNPGSGHMDGFGYFEYGILFNTQGGGKGVDSTLSFTVTRSSGFSSVYDLVENSTGGGFASPFAIDVNYQGVTGVIGATAAAVPEPATLLLLGCGLLGLCAFRRRLQR